jgi:hypothetical protein
LALAGLILLRGLDLSAAGSKGGSSTTFQPHAPPPTPVPAPPTPKPPPIISLYRPGEDLQQIYIAAYLKIGQALDAEKQGDTTSALADDYLALNTLLNIQKADPNWEPAMVGQSVASCRAAVARLTSGEGRARVATSTLAKKTLFSSKNSLEQCYLQAYLVLSEAGQAQKRGDDKTALADYRLTLNTLLDIQNADPNWETALVVHRIADCRTEIENLQ